ncbi:hypothetical protein [Flavobacterium sp. U410]
MQSLLVHIFEILLVVFIIIGIHFYKKRIGIGALYVFVGAVQFFQTLLVSNVYDNYVGDYRFSPGSTIFYTATLFSILLIFHVENLIKTRALIYGIIISNIAITFIAQFLVVQNHNIEQSSGLFLEEILSFELTIFLIGTSLLYLEAMFIVMFYDFLNFKFRNKGLFLKIFVTMSLVCLIDSVVFYTFFYFTHDNFKDLIIGNIIGKQITVVVFSICLYFYFKYNKNLRPKRTPTSLKEVLKIFTF